MRLGKLGVLPRLKVGAGPEADEEVLPVVHGGVYSAGDPAEAVGVGRFSDLHVELDAGHFGGEVGGGVEGFHVGFHLEGGGGAEGAEGAHGG